MNSFGGVAAPPSFRNDVEKFIFSKTNGVRYRVFVIFVYFRLGGVLFSPSPYRQAAVQEPLASP